MRPGTPPRGVPALDLVAQYRSIRQEVEPIVRSVIESQRFVLGPEVAHFEHELAQYCQASRGIGCASGSDALLLPLMAWNIGPGDEVITTPYTFFATAGAIWRLGAKPVFVDILPETFNIDPAQVETAITPRTKAIIPVDLYGQLAEMDPILELAERHGIRVLQDSAQSIGAEDHLGRRAGSIAHATAFSFYPSKNLGAFGDAGMVITNDDQTADRIARLRVHGMEPKYHHELVGVNSRLDALQAAVLRVKLRHLDDWIESRQRVAARYRSLVSRSGLDDHVQVPDETRSTRHVYNQFVIRVDRELRDDLRAHLMQKGIGTEIYYPIPLHLQTCFASLGHQPGDFPISEQAAAETIALPIYPELTETDQVTVIESIAAFILGPPTLGSRKLILHPGQDHATGEPHRPARDPQRQPAAVTQARHAHREG